VGPTYQPPLSEQGPPVSTPSPRGCHTPAPLTRLKGSVGTARRRPDSHSDRAPRCLRRRLASRAPVPTAPSSVSEVDRRCPAASAVASSSTVSGARGPSCRFFFRGVLSLPPSPSSPSQDRRRPPEPLPHRRTSPPIRFFSPSPSTRSSGELSPPLPCPAGSLSAVGARAPSFAPPPPL
jgi:hypothetical protein